MSIAGQHATASWRIRGPWRRGSTVTEVWTQKLFSSHFALKLARCASTLRGLAVKSPVQLCHRHVVRTRARLTVTISERVSPTPSHRTLAAHDVIIDE